MAYLRHFSWLFLVTLVLAAQFQSTEGENLSEKSHASFLRESSAKQETSIKKSAKEANYATKLEDLGIELKSGKTHRKDSKPTLKTATHCKSLVYQTLEKLPESHKNQLSDLTLFYTKDGRRGLGGGSSIILRCLNVADSELISVLLHEMGHLVDGGLLFGTDTTKESGFFDFEDPVLTDDPSLKFYKTSWTSEKKKKSGITRLDFVSLYAMTDPFEDFAETYMYYRVHGAEFKKLAQSNDALKEKYDFMKNLFDGEQFGESNKEVKINLRTRHYDATVLPFSLDDFLS